MGLGPASVSGAFIQATFTPADVMPLSTPERLNLPINFANVSNLQKMSGVFTPANNTDTIKSFSANDQANFALLVVDQPAVVTLSSNAGTPIDQLCVQRFLYIGLSSLPGLLATLTLDGTTSTPEVPMAQSLPCSWTLYYGQAALS